LFIVERTTLLARRYRWSNDWPGEASRSVLARRSGGLFIWGSTAMRFLEDEEVDDPKAQLRLLLADNVDTSPSVSPWKDLDALYLRVLSWAFTSKTSQQRFALFRQVVGAIVTARNPMSAVGLDLLLDLTEDADYPGQIAEGTVRKLHSILKVAENKPIEIIHPSFANFLINSDRCTDKNFLVHPATQNEHLTLCSFRLMAKLLRKNICGLDPTLLNSEVIDLETNISLNIPEGLQYACSFWGDHLLRAPATHDIYDLLATFYLEYLLSWLEVLSVLDAINSFAFQILEAGLSWLAVRRWIS
jgi:hypothetical protein